MYCGKGSERGIYDVFIEQINALKVMCPVHKTLMHGRKYEVRTGYFGILRKVMYMGICDQQRCCIWFEYMPLGRVILWP